MTDRSRWCGRCGDRMHTGECPLPFCDCTDGVPMKGWRYADEKETRAREQQRENPED